MGYRDRLQPAAFKGQRFYVREASRNGGPRVSVIEMAGYNGSVQQRNGTKPEIYDLVAYFWGENYDVARDDFEALLEQEEPGAITLPTRGDKWVRVIDGPHTTETKNEGGYCS